MLDSFLPKALFISLTVHTILLCSSLLPHLPKVMHPPKPKGVEITYKPSMKKPVPDVREHPIKPMQQLDLKHSLTNALAGEVPMPVSKVSTALSKDFMMVDRKRQQIHSAQMTHQISVKPIKSEKINNPAYTMYSSMVRNLIENKVYENFYKMEAGSVYLTFVLSREGILKAVQIIDEKTNASPALREISLLSFKQTQFPPFLKGMTLPEYTFNIEIQYQVKE